MELSFRIQYYLYWLRKVLALGLSKQSQPRDIATIGISWGDGSGTRMGDTINFLTMGYQDTNIDLDIWMRIWDGTVFLATSNWKEI